MKSQTEKIKTVWFHSYERYLKNQQRNENKLGDTVQQNRGYQREKWWEEDEESHSTVREGGETSGDQQAIEYTEVVLQSCTTEIYIISNQYYINTFNFL